MLAIHTSINESFGIAIAETMAAGLITIAHKSGIIFQNYIKSLILGGP